MKVPVLLNCNAMSLQHTIDVYLYCTTGPMPLQGSRLWALLRNLL